MMTHNRQRYAFRGYRSELVFRILYLVFRIMFLETPRLLLRDFTADDWPAVFAYQRDPRYLRLYEWSDRTPEAVQAFVQMFIDQQHARPRTRFQLAVTLRQTGEAIGNCGIRRESPTSHEAEIGYEIAPDQWGRGYASEAVAAIVRFGIEPLLVHRISARLADGPWVPPFGFVGQHTVQQPGIEAAVQHILIRMHVIVVRDGGQAVFGFGLQENLVGDRPPEGAHAPPAPVGTRGSSQTQPGTAPVRRLSELVA